MKEFKRNMCFTFFESYLEQGKMIKEQMGDKECSDYFIGLAEYALYGEEPNSSMAKMLVSGLKNSIDACQDKRERAFNGKHNGENMEQTEAIIKYYEENPNATQREVAKAVGVSVGKVCKVKKVYLSNDVNVKIVTEN